MKTHFSSMSGRISMECDLTEFSGSQKIQLFKYLLDNLKISDRFHEEKQTRAFELIQEEFNRVYEEGLVRDKRIDRERIENSIMY